MSDWESEMVSVSACLLALVSVSGSVSHPEARHREAASWPVAP